MLLCFMTANDTESRQGNGQDEVRGLLWIKGARDHRAGGVAAVVHEHVRRSAVLGPSLLTSKDRKSRASSQPQNASH